MEAVHDQETGERHVGGICGAGKGFPNNDFDALRFVFVRKSFLLFCRNMKNRVIIFMLVAEILFGCSSRQSSEMAGTLASAVKTTAQLLQSDTLRFSQELIHANKYYVYQDTVLVVINRATEKVPFVEFYHMTDGNRLLDRRIPQGKGPGEMLQVFAYLNGNMLQINDFVRKQIALINMDSLLQDPMNYRIPSFAQYQVFSFGKTQWIDGKWVFENPYAFKNEKIGIKNQTKRLLVGDQTTTMEDFGKYQYQTVNVSQGLLFANRDKNRVVYAALHYPIIEFYDSQISLFKTIWGPDDFSDQQFVIVQGEVIFKRTIPCAYKAYCYTEDFICLAYSGEMMNFREKSEKDLHSWIFRFDWDGNFVDSYYCPSHITALSVGSDGKTLYATIRDRDDMPLLVKLSGIKN